MRHKNSYDKFCSNLCKSTNSEVSIISQDNTSQEKPQPFHKRTISLTKINKRYKCNEHNRNFYKYCIKCKDDICPQCYNNKHFIHDNINYEDISLNKKQMNLFKKEYNEYIKIYKQIITIIRDWGYRFHQAVADFEAYMKKNVIDMINNMINNYDINNINYNTIIEYRIIFSFLLENNEENMTNQKMIKLMNSYINLNKYDIHQYFDPNQNLSSVSKDILSILNNIINKGNFLQQGNNIIKFLFNNFPLFSNKIESGDNNYEISDMDKNKKWDNFINNKDDLFYNEYNNNNYNGKKFGMLKNNKSSNNILDSSRNFKKLLFDGAIYEKKKPFDKNKNRNIFLEKEDIPIFSHNSPVK
jgi:hypothetical protein